MNVDNKHACPKCGSPKLKEWADLGPDEKLIVERLPGSAEFTREQRMKHRFCARCFYEILKNNGPVTA